jgi:long-chain fatty acid transport protein
MERVRTMKGSMHITQTIRSSFTAASFAAVVALCPAQARANGLEAPTSASARYSAIGGAAASSVEGADALLLNPAGLGRADGLEVVVNVQPVYNRVQAPIASPSDTVTSKRVAPLAELLFAYQLFKGLAVGAGVNAAGGLGADYGNVSFGDYSMKPEISQTIGSAEASLGLGYQLTDRLSVGGAWRASVVKGNVKSAAPGPNGMLQALDISGASATSFTGFRFGAQYRGEDDRWGVGVVVRTPVDWKLTGQGSVALSNAQTTLPAMPVGDVTMKMVFPLQVAAGVHAALFPRTRLYAQYSWSRYSANETQELTIAGQTSSLRADWNDRHTAQVGAEYQLGRGWALRAGYVFESAVVPRDRPNIYAPPAVAHTVGLGAGTQITDSLRLDAALHVSLSGGVATPAADAAALPGSYRNDSYVASVSGAYRF